MSKVFILTNTLLTGGAEKQSIYLYLALKDTYDAQLIVYNGHKVSKRMISVLGEYTPGSVYFLKGSHVKKLRFIYRQFKQHQSGTCFSYLATSNFINAVIGSLAGLKYRYGGIRNSKLQWFKEIVQKVLHNSVFTGSVFNNYVGYSVLVARGFNADKSTVIHNCIDIPPQEKTNLQNKVLTVLSVGRFVEQKDYRTSLKAFQLLLDSGIKAKYIIVGHGVLHKELTQFTEGLKISDSVEFVVNPPDVNMYYKRADIYLSTSLFEGLSNSIMEAMTYSLPVVATNVGDNSYLVKEQKTGYLLEIGDETGIAKKLITLAGSSVKREKMGKEGFQYMKENFSIESLKEKYIQLIKSNQ